MDSQRRGEILQAKNGVLIMRANQFRNSLYQDLLRAYSSEAQELGLHCVSNPMRLALELLFRPARAVHAAVEGYKQKFRFGQEPIIGLHLRLGNRNPSFVDTKRHSEKDISKFVRCAQMLEDYYYLPNTTRWFVASDSPIALPAIRQMVSDGKVLSVEPPTIVHTERSVRSLAKTFLHFVFLEHFLLARCDYLVLSESGFGATAAAWGGIEGPFHGLSCTTFVDAVSEIDEKRTNLIHE